MREFILSKIKIKTLLPQGFYESLDTRRYVSRPSESHFKIKLGEFWLPVRPKILITKASCHLKVLRYATGHEYLLVLLRTLWQSIGFPLDPGWHYEFSCTFRSRLKKQGCLDLHESLPNERGAQILGDI